MGVAYFCVDLGLSLRNQINGTVSYKQPFNLKCFNADPKIKSLDKAEVWALQAP